MEKEEVRKGPWTEQEDDQLVFYVTLFGDRRWDFIAKVSGLKRTGKSCRLRWVNYLRPGLKGGKMTPHEERLVLELHSKWGNRWSRIARKLPGRTDNEIKNYWRTHVRKKAQERKKCVSPSSSSSSTNSSVSSVNFKSPTVAVTHVKGNKERSFYDAGGKDLATVPRENRTVGEIGESTKVCSWEEIWKDIELSEESSNFTSQATTSPLWDFWPTGSLWSMDEEESKMLMQQIGVHVHSFPFNSHVTTV